MSPNVEIRIGSKPIMTVVGDAKYVYGEKFDTDMTLDSSLLKSPVVLKGKLLFTNVWQSFISDQKLNIIVYSGTIDNASTKSKSRWDTDMVLRSPFANTKVSGFTQTKDGLISTRMEFRYDWNDATKHQFIVNGKIKDMGKGKLTRYMVNT